MADIDFGALLQNPLFMGGIQGLLATPQNRMQAFAQGVNQASKLKGDAQLQQLNALKLQQAQNSANFTPNDYMGTNPVQGTATPTALAGQQAAPAMPATLGGLLGGAVPMQDTSQQAPAPVSPQAGTPNGQVDTMALLSAGLKAGMSPEQIQSIGTLMNPRQAQLIALQGKTTPLSPGQTLVDGLGNPIATNSALPQNSQVTQLQQLTAARDAAKAAGNTAMSDQYDAAIGKLSGTTEVQQAQQRMAETAAQHDATNENRETNRTNLQQQRQFANQQQVQNQATKFSTQLEHTGIPQADATLNTIEGIMSKYPAGQLPGYGRVQGLLPNSALNEDGQQLRQAIAQLANVNLKQRSGAAVTQQEYTRFKNELGNSTFMPEDRIRQGVAQMRNLVEAQKKNAVAGVSDEALDAYEGQGGLPLSYLRPPKQGSVALPNASLSDIDAAIARKQGK